VFVSYLHNIMSLAWLFICYRGHAES